MTPSAGTAGRGPDYDPAVLRRRRTDAGLSQAELARRAGRTRAYISALEAGTSGASPDSLARIAAVLGCRIADLRRGGPVWEVLPLLAREELAGRTRMCEACLPGLLRVLAPDLAGEDDDTITRRWDELVDAIATGQDPDPVLDALAATEPKESR